MATRYYLWKSLLITLCVVLCDTLKLINNNAAGQVSSTLSVHHSICVKQKNNVGKIEVLYSARDHMALTRIPYGARGDPDWIILGASMLHVPSCTIIYRSVLSVSSVKDVMLCCNGGEVCVKKPPIIDVVKGCDKFPNLLYMAPVSDAELVLENKLKTCVIKSIGLPLWVFQYLPDYPRKSADSYESDG